MSEHVSSTLKVKGILSFWREIPCCCSLVRKINHPYSQSKGGREDICIRLQADLLLFEEQSAAPARLSQVYSCCQKKLKINLVKKHSSRVRGLYLAYKTGSKETKWRGSGLRCSPWWQLCSSLLHAEPRCWTLARLPAQLELTFCHWAWLCRASSSPSLPELFPNYN